MASYLNIRNLIDHILQTIAHRARHNEAYLDESLPGMSRNENGRLECQSEVD